MECVTCWRWGQKAPHDFTSGRCGLTGTETPGRYSCGWWIDHPGEVSVAEQLERKQRAAEALRQRHEEEERQRQAARRLELEDGRRQRRGPTEKTRRRVQACWDRMATVKELDQRVRYVSARAGVKESTVRIIVGLINNE